LNAPIFWSSCSNVSDIYQHSVLSMPELWRMR
jgi:hypothetical protein